MKEKDTSLVCLLHEINHRLHEIKFSVLKDEGITFPQMMILGFLHRNIDNNVNQKAIQEKMKVKGSSVTSILSTMQKSGLITKVVNPDDGREFFIKLTAKGKEIGGNIKSVLEGIDGKAEEILNEEEKVVLRSLLQKILDNIVSGDR